MNRNDNQEYRTWRILFAAAPFIVFASLVIIEYWGILAECGGKFIYSLDDPYIHLALAEQIASGTYGINPGEAASPSSSAVWPFLLVPFSRLAVFELIPLALNLAIGAATLYVYTKTAGLALRGLPPLLASAASAWIAILLIPATNLVGLAFTGMEHTLQVFFCSAIVFGLGAALQNGKPPCWLVYALAAAPWVRYECLAVAIPAAAVLLARGHWRTALAGLAGGAAGLAIFSLFLHTQGLAWLPASVLVKSRLVAPGGEVGGLFNSLLEHLRANLNHPRGEELAYASLGLALVLLFCRGKRLIALFGFLAAWMHLAAGQFGWWDRYEVYIATTLLLTWLVIGSAFLVWLFRRLPAVLVLLALVPLALPTGIRYTKNFQRTPIAAANIYEQQYQMHRFTVDYLRAPVAVNDLGWVAFQNPDYVLDLWGLASLEALQLRTSSGGDPAWMDDLSRARGVRVAMVYDTWLGRIPRTWTRVARLHLGKPQASAGGDKVTFYVLEPEQVQPVIHLLEAFEKTLPPGVPLDIFH